MECTFYVYSYWSASDYRKLWNTTGCLEEFCSCHQRLTVKPGDLIFVRVDEAQYDKAVLYRVPGDDVGFREFCRKAEEVAGQAVFDRISRVLHASRRTPRDRQLLESTPSDFVGVWLNPYKLNEWVWEFEEEEIVKIPHTIEEALRRLSEV